MTQREWDLWFLGMARYVASASKDPSTKTGAVIIDAKRRIVSVGYNGFARGVDDDPARYADRETKYRMVVHAEVNAILFAGRSLDVCTLYTVPFQSCAPCAALVIQSGIKRCVAPPLSDELAQRWGRDVELAQQMFREAGVELVILPEGKR
jgi:dCMP deaminase